MTFNTRKHTRQAIGAKMNADLVGENLPAAAFAFYHKSDFDGASPVITLSTAGADEPPLTPVGSIQTYFYEVSSLVMRPNATEVLAGYSEEDVEDALDDVYDAIRQWISQNRKDKENGEWKHVAIEGRSSIIPIVDPGGRGYFMENIPIRVEVY